jgi:hypothetical protein
MAYLLAFGDPKGDGGRAQHHPGKLPMLWLCRKNWLLLCRKDFFTTRRLIAPDVGAMNMSLVAGAAASLLVTGYPHRRVTKCDV